MSRPTSDETPERGSAEVTEAPPERTHRPMPRYLDPLEIVRQDAYHEALDLLADLERTATMQTSHWLPNFGELGEKFAAAGITNDDLRALLGPWMSTYFEGVAQEIREKLNTKPREARSKVKPRDGQQSKLYLAEKILPQGALLTLSQAQRYVVEVISDPTVRRLYPEVEVDQVTLVVPKKPGKKSTCTTTGSAHVLKVVPNMLTRNTILHELSHAFTNAHWGHDRVQSHGAEFAYTFLRLVYLRFGKHIGFMLQTAYDDAGVVSTNRRASLAPVLAPVAAQVTT
jgi:hypothetical protein